MPYQISIESLQHLAMNELEVTVFLLKGPETSGSDPGHCDPFIREILKPVEDEIRRREDGREIAPTMATIEHLADVEGILLEPLGRAYHHFGRMFPTIPRMGEYPAAISGLIQRELLRRQSLLDSLARSR